MKNVKKIVEIISLIMLSVFIFSTNVEATTIGTSYCINNSESTKKNPKVHSNDEIIISLSLDNEDEKVMAVFGALEYDKDVLELLEFSDNNSSTNLEVGTGWSIGYISLNGNAEHDKEQLKNLHELQFDKYDTISLKAQNPNAVKITGNIISENSNENSKVANSYENGFGTTDKYSQVRFKITDDGLKEITQKKLTISGATAITIKRGDTLELLEGVSVNVNDQNNDDYKLTVEEITSNGKAVTIAEDENDTDDSTQSGVITEDKNKFTKLKEGTYTVRYTATNSWGATTTVDRKITVEPRTDLEKVKLTVKDINNNNVLVIGFDSITRKLRVIEHTNGSINYLDDSQVFEINAYDSLGKTLGTIALKGSQTIDQTIINRINAFPYEEGYSLSVWSKVIDNKIDITGSITTEKENSKEESKKSRYKRSLTSDDKRDKLENGRFKILSDGLKYIYNKAPVITGGDETIPYYKGNLLKAPSSLKINDDHDGEISTTEVTVNDDNVDYDTLGIQNITYIAEDSWGRSATKPGSIEIRSAMDSNIINIYSIDGIEGVSISFARDNINNQNKIMVNTNEELNTTFNPNSLSDIFATIKIYDFNGNLIATTK